MQFKKTQQAMEGKQAMVQYEADAIAMRKKTERLKALRLARDAANPLPPAKKKAARKAKPAKDRPATLSEWWKDQKEDGRTG